MRDGLVQQIGTSDEIYERPVNMFVASFLGNPPINYLTGTLTGSASIGYATRHYQDPALNDLSGLIADASHL